MTWLDLPTVTVPSPNDPSVIWTCTISDVFVPRNAMIGRKTPIFQLWAHVVGQLPPINLVGSVAPAPSLMTLHDAYACYQGVKRPYVQEEDGRSVLVYVLSPTISLAFHPSMACLARSVTVPSNTVLTVQIRPENCSGQNCQEGINGIVTRIEFVLGDGGNPQLPKDHDVRYNQLKWKR